MKHQGIEYSVVQTADPKGWKWTFQLPGRKPKSETAFSRDMAVRSAEMAIDKALKIARSST